MELLVSLSLLPVLVMIGVAVTRGTAVEVQRTIRVGVDDRLRRGAEAFLRYELADAERGDLTLSTATLLNLRRKIGAGATCAWTSRSATVAQADWVGLRQPDAVRDELLLLNNAGNWSTARVISITSTSCPDGRSAFRLATDVDVMDLSYLRVLEPVRLRVYRSGEFDWLGLAPGDGTGSVQPFAGPLRVGSGQFQLTNQAVSFSGVTGGGTTISLQFPVAGGQIP